MKVISQLDIGAYNVLTIDTQIPKKKFSKCRIGRQDFEPITVYDMPNCVAVESKDNFVGNTIEFI